MRKESRHRCTVAHGYTLYMKGGQSTGQETNKRGILFCCGTVVALRARRNNEEALFQRWPHRDKPRGCPDGLFPNLFIYSLYYDDETPKATPYTYQCGSDRFAPPGPRLLSCPGIAKDTSSKHTHKKITLSRHADLLRSGDTCSKKFITRLGVECSVVYFKSILRNF